MANSFLSLCSILTQDGTILGHSDDTLERHVTALPSYTDWYNVAYNNAVNSNQLLLKPKEVKAVQVLHDNITVNTAQVLHDFSTTYGLKLSPNAARLSVFWGILKYLDAFSLVPKTDGEYLELTNNAQEASHNQRRVMSEELGVAFSIHHGKNGLLTLSPAKLEALSIPEQFRSLILRR